MSTTFTAIHYTESGEELTADFTFSDAGRSTANIRVTADAAMMAKHGIRAQGWSLPPKPPREQMKTITVQQSSDHKDAA